MSCRSSAFAIAVALPLLASCKSCEEKPAAPDASAAADVVAPPPAPPDAEAAAPVDAAVPVVNVDASTPDAGASSCRLVYGPAEQPFRGPAAMAFTSNELRLVTNDAGKPRIYPVPLAPPAAKGAPVVVPPKPSSFAGMRWPPCELAGRFAYCQAPGGPIVRTTLGASDSKTIAKSRSGTRIAAASLGGEHAVVAFLDSRRTTEGEMLQAFVALDERDPVRLSDDGAGATTLRLFQRGAGAVAVYLDTRTAMVPVHARPLAMRGDDLAVADDVVVFVGGAPERGIDFAVASAGAKTFALVPMPRDVADFGMAALAIGDPPKEAIDAIWSPYPNGLDPAPIASAPSRSGKDAWVVRVRTAERDRNAPRVLELGRIDGAGAFVSLGVIGKGAGITDLAIAEDAQGAVWILYGDSNATWLERRVCLVGS